MERYRYRWAKTLVAGLRSALGGVAIALLLRATGGGEMPGQEQVILFTNMLEASIVLLAGFVGSVESIVEFFLKRKVVAIQAKKAFPEHNFVSKDA